MFLGRLVSGPNHLGVPWQRVGRTLLDRLASRLFPFGALGSGRLAKGTGPGPKVPTINISFLPLMLLLKKLLSLYFLFSFTLILLIFENTEAYVD